jgi:glycosyltransferase involved in cell wall biosynthesis
MPKVSIIIPVYNVEKYLRECLDSVVNQTLRDIEIICVNDGSPDRSPQILEEYASRDSRITVIHKENGGLSSARNAALPYIKSEYTLFVDSDDWIEPDLCEKTVTVADQEKADMTCFLYYNSQHYKYDKLILQGKGEQYSLNDWFYTPMVWLRLWRSDFILKNNLKFSEVSKCFSEDNIFNFVAFSCEPKLAFIPKRLYSYRQNPSGTMQTAKDKLLLNNIIYFDEYVKQLQHLNKYQGEWKNIFLQMKLYKMYGYYFTISKKYKLQMLEAIRKNLGQDEHDFLMINNDLPWHVTDFYAALYGSRIAHVKCMFANILRSMKRILLKMIEKVTVYRFKVQPKEGI